MSLHEETEKVLKKQMSRKQFLQHIGLAFLAVIGVNAFISRMIHPERHTIGASAGEGRKWGNGKFGV